MKARGMEQVESIQEPLGTRYAHATKKKKNKKCEVKVGRRIDLMNMHSSVQIRELTLIRAKNMAYLEQLRQDSWEPN
jgi:hypothetical protein